MTDHQILDEARRLVDGDIEIPAWAVAIALQLGYTGSIVFHVAQVVLKWHDLYAVKGDGSDGG